jgi:hypothetical protein
LLLDLNTSFFSSRDYDNFKLNQIGKSLSSTFRFNKYLLSLYDINWVVSGIEDHKIYLSDLPDRKHRAIGPSIASNKIILANSSQRDPYV